MRNQGTVEINQELKIGLITFFLKYFNEAVIALCIDFLKTQKQFEAWLDNEAKFCHILSMFPIIEKR